MGVPSTSGLRPWPRPAPPRFDVFFTMFDIVLHNQTHRKEFRVIARRLLRKIDAETNSHLLTRCCASPQSSV
jgi:hypothetical protein